MQKIQIFEIAELATDKRIWTDCEHAIYNQLLVRLFDDLLDKLINNAISSRKAHAWFGENRITAVVKYNPGGLDIMVTAVDFEGGDDTGPGQPTIKGATKRAEFTLIRDGVTFDLKQTEGEPLTPVETSPAVNSIQAPAAFPPADSFDYKTTELSSLYIKNKNRSLEAIAASELARSIRTTDWRPATEIDCTSLLPMTELNASARRLRNTAENLYLSYRLHWNFSVNTNTAALNAADEKPCCDQPRTTITIETLQFPTASPCSDSNWPRHGQSLIRNQLDTAVMFNQGAVGAHSIGRNAGPQSQLRY